MDQKVDSTSRCKRCNKGAILTDSNAGEMFYSKCGFVSTDRVEQVAAALYLSCVKNGEDKTQRDIAEAANVTEVTIRNRYKRTQRR